MTTKPSGQFSFVEALLPQGLGRSGRLDRLSSLVKWYRFEKILARLRSPAGPGRPAYNSLVMFKALLLQSLYGLSDSELEEALADRLSFRRFVGLTLEERVPDHTTLNRFRNLLVEAELLEKLFGELDRQLDKAGLILRRGTMLDATVIETAAARPPSGAAHEAGDPDAGFTRRQGKPGSSYGYKAHVGVDQGSGLIRRVRTTAANVNDTVEADHLICGDEGAVLADAAYHTKAREVLLRQRGIKPRLMRRANKHHPRLPARLKHFNRLIARQRFAVETTFATLKNRMRLCAIRYRGMAKAAGQVLIAAMAFNMRRWVTLAT
ncbi:transposase [Mesorhizobium sp. Root695]|jgi:IS5 family transposase|uniref:IS5 family transposase n=1 Tax=Mesorhizobium sp. Root102 TaxID=1736422 RepID=UPI0006FB95AA|nr:MULTISPECIES: IS5 family transposase [unclassified Mesorhizobium]KQU83438.1 transposase [Mesorhizobium sp. Root102]KRB33593.1 transposase [Mesorhizobium sp. Root695]